MSSPTRVNVTYEFLELMAAAHAPPLGAALWDAGGDTRLVRHKGEPLTVAFCSSLVIDRREVVEVKKLPASIVAVYDKDTLSHLPGHDKAACNKAVIEAMREDAIDSDALGGRP